MKPITSRLKASVIFSIVLCAGWNEFYAPPGASAESAPAASCTSPEYRQFDFWIGDWDVFDLDNPARAVPGRASTAYSMGAFCGRTIRTPAVTKVRVSASMTHREEYGIRAG